MANTVHKIEEQMQYQKQTNFLMIQKFKRDMANLEDKLAHKTNDNDKLIGQLRTQYRDI